MAGISLEHIISFLLEAPMFGDLDPQELSEVVHIMQVQRLRDGQTVFREGSDGDAWYIVYDGQVNVIKASALGSSIIATLGERSCFGEMAILDGSPRSATVKARGDTTVFRFPRLSFDELLESGNLAAYKLIHQMARVLVARQRQTTTRLVELLDADSGEVVWERVEPIVAGSSVAE